MRHLFKPGKQVLIMSGDLAGFTGVIESIEVHLIPDVVQPVCIINVSPHAIDGLFPFLPQDLNAMATERDFTAMTKRNLKMAFDRFGLLLDCRAGGEYVQ